MSRNASVTSVDMTTVAGISPATILQNRQSSVTPDILGVDDRKDVVAKVTLQRYLCLMPEDRTSLSAHNLRGIAHPLRVRLLNLLREDGPSTATRLAERTGQSSGATSYHLRQLAQYGFVEEDPTRDGGRERWWRATTQTTSLDAATYREAPAETEAYLRAVAAEYADRVDRWLNQVDM